MSELFHWIQSIGNSVFNMFIDNCEKINSQKYELNEKVNEVLNESTENWNLYENEIIVEEVVDQLKCFIDDNELDMNEVSIEWQV